MEKEADQRHDDELHDGQERDVGGQLAEVDRRRIDGRDEQPRQAVVLALEEEPPLDAEEPGEEERRPEDARH